MTSWAVKNHNGQILPEFRGCSRIEVGCKLLPARYDVFRLHVSASYRELFERTLRQLLQQNRWQIVEIKRRKPPLPFTQWALRQLCSRHAARLGACQGTRRNERGCRRKPRRAVPGRFREADRRAPVPWRQRGRHDRQGLRTARATQILR
jgi:hypothetical protein